MHTNEDRLMPLPEVAKITGVSVSTIRRLIEQGGLTAVRVGHRVLVRASQVASLVAGQSDVDGR